MVLSFWFKINRKSTLTRHLPSFINASKKYHQSITEVSSKHCQSITEASKTDQTSMLKRYEFFKTAFQPLFKLCTLVFVIPLKCLLAPFFSLQFKYLIFKPKMPLPLYLATVRYIMSARSLAPGIWVSSIPVNRHPPLVASMCRALYNMRMRKIRSCMLGN